MLRLMATIVTLSTGLLLGCVAPRVRNAAGLATSAPRLQLSPDSLGRSLALQQQLSFSVNGERTTVESVLEVDAKEVRLAIQMAGQAALRLRWDGKRLEQWRANWLPPALRGERVLSDLQLAFWPVPTINAAMPHGWSFSETAGMRQLRHGDETVTELRFPASDRIDIEQRREGFTLSIISVPMTESRP